MPKLKRCASCDKLTDSGKKVSGKMADGFLCQHCLEEQVEECPSCLKFGRLTDKGVCFRCHNLYEDNKCSSCGRVRDGDRRCRHCGSSRGRVYNYTLKPRPQFHYTPKDLRKQERIFFGVEKEVTYSGSTQMGNALQKIYSKFDPTMLVCKSDASISGYGFEVVTQPFTLSWFQKADLSGLFSIPILQSDSCGMHIHVSRTAFDGDLHIYKVTNFIHNNEKFIDIVARRSYCSYSRKVDGKVSKLVIKKKRGQGTERHLRVNLRNEKTVEFRMFAGALRETQIKYSVEFLHALITWTRNQSLINTDVKSFYEYIVENKDKYPSIQRFLSRNAKDYIA